MRPDKLSELPPRSDQYQQVGTVPFYSIRMGDSYCQAFQESYQRVKEGFPPPVRGNVGQVIDPSDPQVQGWRDGARAAALEGFSKR